MKTGCKGGDDGVLPAIIISTLKFKINDELGGEFSLKWMRCDNYKFKQVELFNIFSCLLFFTTGI